MIAFCTVYSSGLGNSDKNLAKKANGGEWLAGKSFGERASEKEIKVWFDKIGTPTRLSQLEIDSEALINEIAGVAYENAKAWAMQELYPKKNIVQILELAK